MGMVSSLDNVAIIHTTLAEFFTWILLAGFVVIPGTFVNPDTGKTVSGKSINLLKSKVLGLTQHTDLFAVACACTAIGLIGMCCYWYKWRSNYIWLGRNIFGPAARNSLAGVIATLSSVYGINNKLRFEGSSKLTLYITGGLTVICGVLHVFYKCLLRNMKKEHYRVHGKRRAGTSRRGDRAKA